MKVFDPSNLLRHWERVSLMPAASKSQIEAFERRHMVRLPADVQSYYGAANGFAPPNDQDERGFSFWPLDRVTPMASFKDGEWAAEGTEDCFIFADYLSLSWGYAFRLSVGSPNAAVCLVGTADRRPIWIADDFRHFVDLYVNDDARLYRSKT